MSTFIVRPPQPTRLYLAVFGIGWCVAVGFGLVETVTERTPAVVLPLLMLGVGGTFITRSFRSAVIAEEDNITIRNIWRTRTIQRAELEGFRIGPGSSGRSLSSCVNVLLADESLLPLDATMRTNPFPGGGRRVDRQLAQLREWLEGR